MNRRNCICFLCSLLLSLNADAQTAYIRKANSIVKSYIDSLSVLTKDNALVSNRLNDVSLNPYLYPMLGPTTYYSMSTKRLFSIDWGGELSRGESCVSDGMRYRDKISDKMDHELMRLYCDRPITVGRYDGQYLKETLVESAEINEEKKPGINEVLKDVKEIKDVTEIIDDVDVDIHVTRPNFWKTSGSFSLQFTQNYFSENWYKGGNNNGTLLAKLMVYANYNDQRRIQWDNRLDMRLGFVTTTSDSCHTFLTNTDKLNLYSKLGVRSRRSWYYTVSLEANTQFMPGYRSNDRRVYSNFLSPLDVYLSIGMDYKPSLKRGNTLSVALLPLSYKLRYISSDDENIRAVYRLKNKTSEQSFGSKVEVNSKMNLLKNLEWRCRFYYYTSYEYAEGELENSLVFSFSKYIKSEVFTLWRFDDSRDKRYFDDNLGYFQFNEYFTLGLTYDF